MKGEHKNVNVEDLEKLKASHQPTLSWAAGVSTDVHPGWIRKPYSTFPQ